MKPIFVGPIAVAVALLTVPSSESANTTPYRPAPRLIRSAFYDPTTTASIGLDSSLDQVRQVFGLLPKEVDHTYFYECDGGPRIEGLAKTIFYTGFTVSLEQFPASSEYKTTSITIRAPNIWITPGLGVGMSVKSVRHVLGEPDLSALDGGTGDRILHYSFDEPPGDLRLHFTHGVLTIIELLGREWPSAG